MFFAQEVEDERPPIDLFKSIFTESSASELSEEEDSEEENKPPNHAIISTNKETITNNANVVKEQSTVQPKQLNDKKSQRLSEARDSLRETVEPKLTWMGVRHVTKPSEQPTPSIVTKPEPKPSITAALPFSQYGPSIPPSIEGTFVPVVF